MKESVIIWPVETPDDVIARQKILVAGNDPDAILVACQGCGEPMLMKAGRSEQARRYGAAVACRPCADMILALAGDDPL